MSDKLILCHHCIHREVCGHEGVDDPALTFCDDCLPINGWISVEDRMPECGVNVLVITNYGEFAIAQRRDNSAVRWADEWMLQYEPGETDVWDEEQHGIITHWMPLPEPPKEVKDEEKIKRLAERIELILNDIYNTGRMMQDFDYEAIFKCTRELVGQTYNHREPPKEVQDDAEIH